MNSKSCRLLHAMALNSYFTNRIRIRQRVRKAERHVTPDDIQDYTRKRQRLSVRINDFHITANRLLGGQALGSVIGKHDILSEDGYVSDEGRAPEDRGLQPCLTDIENTITPQLHETPHLSCWICVPKNVDYGVPRQTTPWDIFGKRSAGSPTNISTRSARPKRLGITYGRMMELNC